MSTEPRANTLGDGSVEKPDGSAGKASDAQGALDARRVLAKVVLAFVMLALGITSLFPYGLGTYEYPQYSGWVPREITCPGVVGTCMQLSLAQTLNGKDLTFVIPRCAAGDPIVTEIGVDVRTLDGGKGGRYVRITFPGCPSNESLVARVQAAR